MESGKNRGNHTQLLHARHATRTWQIFRTHACFLRFTVVVYHLQKNSGNFGWGFSVGKNGTFRLPFA